MRICSRNPRIWTIHARLTAAFRATEVTTSTFFLCGCRTSVCSSCLRRLIWKRAIAGLALRRYWTTACQSCSIKSCCTPAKQRRITRWEHEHMLEAGQRRLDENSKAMHLTHCSPSSEIPPPGTIMCTCGWWVIADRIRHHCGRYRPCSQLVTRPLSKIESKFMVASSGAQQTAPGTRSLSSNAK